jgi:hypothetical protein
MIKPHAEYLKLLGKKISELSADERKHYNSLSWSFKIKNEEKKSRKCKYCDKEFCSRESGRKKYCTKNCAKAARDSKVKLYLEENKESIKKTTREYVSANKEKILEYNRRWVAENRQLQKEYNEHYYATNKEKVGLYNSNYYRINCETIKSKNKENYKNQSIEIVSNKREKARELYRNVISEKIRRFVSNAFRRMAINKPVKTEEILGCSYEEAKQHIESLFTEGMSWENHGEWHIDHIKPIASIDCNNLEEALSVNRIENLQPLWAKDNLSKQAKYEGVNYRVNSLAST